MISAYDMVWIPGDKFICQSASVLRQLFGLLDEEISESQSSNDGAKEIFQDEGYISKNYDVEVFTSKSSNNMRSSLGRFINVMASALNAHVKLPKYIIVVMEEDVLRCINFSKPGVSEIYGRDLKWLAEEYHDMIMTCKENLPGKARRFHYPQVFWVSLPQHHNFGNNQLQHKFNQCMETVVNLFKEMHLLKIHRHWSYNDFGVTVNGMINETGKMRYWSGIDESIEFWENGKRKSGPGSGREFIQQLHSNHCDVTRAHRGHQRNRSDRVAPATWTRMTVQVKLPRPLPEE